MPKAACRARSEQPRKLVASRLRFYQNLTRHRHSDEIKHWVSSSLMRNIEAEVVCAEKRYAKWMKLMPEMKWLRASKGKSSSENGFSSGHDMISSLISMLSSTWKSGAWNKCCSPKYALKRGRMHFSRKPRAIKIKRLEEHFVLKR